MLVIKGRLWKMWKHLGSLATQDMEKAEVFYNISVSDFTSSNHTAQVT